MNDGQKSRTADAILRWAARGKRIIAGVLMAMMFVLVAIATAELVVGLWSGLSGDTQTAKNLFLAEREILSAFGAFLTVLIAMELIETVEVYFREHAIHAEVVILVALIAVSRKIVLLDFEKYSWQEAAVLAGLIGVLTLGYFLIKQAELPLWVAADAREESHSE